MVLKKEDDDIDEDELDEEVDEELDEELEDEDEEEQNSDEETEVDDEDVDEGAEDEASEDEDKEKYVMADDPDDDSPLGDDRMSGLAADVPVQVVAVLGKRSFNMQELMGFHVGQVVDLYRPANETVDLVVGGKLIAKGELVSIDGKLGVRIIKLI